MPDLQTRKAGVLIWGIDARKDKAKGIDAAQGFRLIQNTSQFKTRLTELLRDVTDPPLPGVELVEIPDSAASVQGFVACYIPEGDFKPYRAEHADRQYYHHVSDNFHVMNLSLLEAKRASQRRSRLDGTSHCERDWLSDGYFDGIGRFAERHHLQGQR